MPVALNGDGHRQCHARHWKRGRILSARPQGVADLNEIFRALWILLDVTFQPLPRHPLETTPIPCEITLQSKVCRPASRRRRRIGVPSDIGCRRRVRHSERTGGSGCHHVLNRQMICRAIGVTSWRPLGVVSIALRQWRRQRSPPAAAVLRVRNRSIRRDRVRDKVTCDRDQKARMLITGCGA